VLVSLTNRPKYSKHNTHAKIDFYLLLKIQKLLSGMFHMKPEQVSNDRAYNLGDEEPDIFWIHLEGRGISNHSPRADIMAQYLKSFDSLVNHVAVYRGYISSANPSESFHVFFAGVRRGCASIGVRLSKKRNLDNYGHLPYVMDKVNTEINDMFVSANRKDGYKYFASLFADPFQRITIYNDIRRLCSTARRKVRITRTRLKDPWEKSSLSINLDENVNTNIQEWTEIEIDKGMTNITGYFTGYRLSHKQFWILLDNETECSCSYSDDRIDRIVDRLRKYDKIKVMGDITIKPGISPVIKKVVDIINLDALAEREADANPDDEYDEDFLQEVKKGSDDARNGRVMSEDDFWKSIKDESKE